ncbi:MAG: hypothetical protein ABH869_06085 [Candidatus Omnitrophota bacterium]
MKNTAELLGNLVPGGGYFKATIKESTVALKLFSDNLYAVHIRICHPYPSIWRKKKYYHITKRERYSRLDEWIFEHLLDNNEYAVYLDRYRPMVRNGKIKKDIDEYIMDRHYRPEAIKILKQKKHFDQALWTKKHIRLEYRRRSNLYWKNGEEFNYDYRNPIESLFILKKNSDREVLGVGGAGSSGQRQMNTFFTAVFYVLGKKKRISNYLFEYDGFNRFKYVGCRYRSVLTPGFGSNFDLDKRFMLEILKNGFYWK